MMTDMDREFVDVSSVCNSFVEHLSPGGVLCSVTDLKGNDNLITLGWGIIGGFYNGDHLMTIAITPQRHSYHLLEEVPEFVIGIPDENIAKAVLGCGTVSGRDFDKFKKYNLTKVPSISVKPPAIRECPINLECTVYTMVKPPHQLLTPRHRQRPISHQHTIYFAYINKCYRWKE